MVTSESSGRPIATSNAKQITARVPRRIRSWLRVRYAPMLLLLGVIAWAGLQIYEMNSPEMLERESIDPREIATAPDIAPVLPGQDIAALLELRIVTTDRDGNETFQALDEDAVDLGYVTVVNLWATYCKPCKEELPELREVLRGAQTRQPFGNKVRFLPLLVDHGATLAEARIVYDKLGGPPPYGFIADADIGGGVRGKLAELGLVHGEFALPMTFVVDCNHRLRWSLEGTLRKSDFTDLAATLAKLQQEFAAGSCPTKASVHQTAKKRRKKKNNNNTSSSSPVPSFLGISSEGEPKIDPESAAGSNTNRGGPRSTCRTDGLCDKERGETVFNCPKDCTPAM